MTAHGEALAAELVDAIEEVQRLRAQVAELLPWAMRGAHNIIEFGKDNVGPVEVVNGKVTVLVRPGAQALIRRIDAGEFGVEPS